MTLRTAHALVLACSLSLALLCVLVGNVLPGYLAWSLVVPWLSAWLSWRNWACPTWAGSLVALGAFAYSASLLFRFGLQAAMVAACSALLGIFVARLLTRRTPSHDLHSLVLSLLLVLAGTVLQQQLSYGLILVAYTVVVIWALVTRQLLHGAAMEAYRTADHVAHEATLQRRDVITPGFLAATAGVAAAILMGTSVLFVAFPRVGLGGFGFGQHHSSQFPSDVSLAGLPRAGGDDTVVARVSGLTYKHFLQGLYLRGTLYDVVSPAGFAASAALLDIKPARLALAPAPAQELDVDYEVYLQPVDEQVLLALGPVTRATPQTSTFPSAAAFERIGVGPASELVSFSPLLGPVRYRVRGGLTRVPPLLLAEGSNVGVEAPEFEDAKFNRHFLSLPMPLDPRIVPLAQRIIGNAQHFATKVTRLRHHLLEHFAYSLIQQNAGRVDPLASFLFDDRRGHCEYFATAFAVLLRAVGVPSRVVGGFEGGIWDPTSQTVLFTGAHAHAWVEWYAPHRGWVVDDATPQREAATLTGVAIWLERARRLWDDEVVDFGLDQQLAMVRGIVGAVRPHGLSGVHTWSPAHRLKNSLPTLLCLSILGGISLWFWRRTSRGRGTKPQKLSPLAKALLNTLERLAGAEVPPQKTLRHAVNQLVPQLGPAQVETLYSAVQAYEQHRFAGMPLSTPQLRRLQRRLQRLRAQAPAKRPLGAAAGDTF